jgi:hypothetical protein
MNDDVPVPPELPPPPVDALKKRMGAITPVRTRRPWLVFVAVALISLAWVGHSFLLHGTRPDLRWLPPLWLAGVGAVWLLAFAWSLSRAILPPRGQVLPDGRAGERAALLVAAALLALSALFTRDVPGRSLDPVPFLPVAWHCLRFSLLLGTGVTVIALMAMRRMLPLLSWRTGAALGAAGGALAGLALHCLCGYSTPAHVTVGHAGGVVAGALLAAIVVRLLGGRANASPQ